MVDQVFSPPTRGKAQNLTQWSAMAVLYGFTNVTQECEKCGRVKVVTILGKAQMKTPPTVESWKSE